MAKKRSADEVKHDEVMEELHTPVRDPNTSAPAPGDVVFPARNRRKAIFTQGEVLEGETREGEELDTDAFGPSEEEAERRVEEAEALEAASEDSDEAEAADSEDSEDSDS